MSTALVSDFRLDRFEVTVARFRAFAEDYDAWRARGLPSVGSGAHAMIPGSGWSAAYALPATRAVLEQGLSAGGGCTGASVPTYSPTPGASDNLPINCMTFAEAFAFCIWDGGYLPTHAEWGYAAAGGDQNRAFAYSMPPTETLINPSRAVYQGAGMPVRVDFVVPQGRWNQLHLAGNVGEWVLDASGARPAMCVDCLVTTGAQRLVRGGAFVDAVNGLRNTANTFPKASTIRQTFLGIRCARP